MMKTSTVIYIVTICILSLLAPSRQQACTGLYAQNMPFSNGMGAAKLWQFTSTQTVIQQVTLAAGQFLIQHTREPSMAAGVMHDCMHDMTALPTWTHSTASGAPDACRMRA